MTAIVNYTDRLTDSMVGGKFAKQAAMRRAGLPVPPFFCATGAFYRRAVASLEHELRALIAPLRAEDGAGVRAGAEAIASRFERLTIAAPDRDAILAAFDDHFAPDQLVSVRASTVGHRLEDSEDSADNPFAGMSASFLYVRRDDVLDRLKACWASGFSAESLLYRLAQGLDPLGFDVAVGVQEMVFGERSFVLFTADPKTAARDPVLVAGYGIGEGVVQERVGVDHYFVTRKSGAIAVEPGAKTTRLSVDPAAGYGLVELPVAAENHVPACLDDDEVRRIVELGDRVESLFGMPQDIEGTITDDGAVHLLQSRPIAIDYRRQLVWSNTNVTESYPGVTTALTYSHARYFYRVIFRDLYRRLGVSPETLHDNFEPLDRMIGFLHGRVYYCLTHFYLLHKQSPLFPIFRAHWENMIGLPASYQTHAGGGARAALERARATGRFAAALVKTSADYARHDRSMTDFHDWWEHRIGPLRGRDLSAEDPYSLVQLFREVWGEVGRQWGVTLTTDAYLIPLYGLAEHLFRVWELDADAGLLSDLLCGDEELLSVEIILSAVALAEQVRADEQLRALFRANQGRAIWDALQAGGGTTGFRDAVEHHLARFGDRGLQELKIEQPALRDTPWVLINMVKQYAARDVTVASIRANERDVRADADRRLHELLRRAPAKLALLERLLLPRLRRLIRHRENSRYCRSELFGFSRKVFHALGAHLVARGVLRAVDDVHHLAQDELFGFIDGTGVTADLQALADLRRREHEANEGFATPEHVTTLGAVHDNAIGELATLAEAGDDGSDDTELRGLGSSAGRVRGTARVVFDPNEVEHMDEDMILVARETDPGWLFLMLASRGIIVERGSMLSHTAITGRKFGIPAIVALPGATRRIPDGAAIEIDGSTGRVTVLEDA